MIQELYVLSIDSHPLIPLLTGCCTFFKSSTLIQLLFDKLSKLGMSASCTKRQRLSRRRNLNSGFNKASLITDLLVINEGLYQLWLQPAQSVHKVPWQSKICVEILWASFCYTPINLFISLTAFMNLLLNRNNLTLCLCLGTEIGIGWESPKNVQNVKPAVCPQQSLSVH